MKKKHKYSYDLERDGVTQSMLTAFLSCPSKVRLGVVQGWSSNRPKRALSYGSLMHKVLELEQGVQREQGKTWKPNDGRVQKFIAETCEADRKKNGDRWSADQEEQLELTKAQLYAILPAYFRHWDPVRWTEIEGIFDMPYEVKSKAGHVHLTTRLRGRKDGVYRAKDKTLWQFDSKSSSRINEDELGLVLTRDYQIMFYMLTTWLQTDEIPTGFNYNIIRKTEMKPGKGGLPEYVQRIKEEVEKRPEHFFKRFEVAIVEEDLSQFRKELNLTLLHLKAWLDNGMPCQMYGMPCVGKYGMCDKALICYENNYDMHHVREHVFAELVDEED